MKLGPVLLGEGHVGEHVVLGIVHAGTELGPAGPQLIGDLTPDLCRGRMIGLKEDLTDGGSHDRVLALGHLGQGIAHEVDAAALPTGAATWLGLSEQPLTFDKWIVCGLVVQAAVCGASWRSGVARPE